MMMTIGRFRQDFFDTSYTSKWNALGNLGRIADSSLVKSALWNKVYTGDKVVLKHVVSFTN